MMIDFPAPVSPVTATNPGPSCHSSSSTSARFLIRNSVRTADIREPDQSHARNPRLQISPSNSAFALFDELDDFGDLFGLRQFFLHRFDRLAGVVFRAVNQAKCFFDQFHAFGRKILAFQSDQISPANFRGITIGDHKRRNILHNFGTAAGDRESADPTELMYGSEPAHHGMISDLNVPAQRAVIRKNDAVADGAIMTDMTVSEEVSAITNARFALARGAAMRCYEFAKCV